MSSSEPQPLRDFLTVAGDLAMLSREDVARLAQEARERAVSAGELVLQKGLLSAVQVDIVETMRRPGEVIPGYEVLDCLGHGGMGVVYRARQKNLDRVVALKTVLVSQMTDPAAAARFEQEAITVARLRHPNVVAAYDFGRHEGRLFLVMELVEGEDLQKLIRRRGMLDESTAWGLARQAAAGLAHAKGEGIVHRDIKPANLLLVDPPEGFPLPKGMPLVKIADFGLAFLTTEAEVRTRITSADKTVGSPHYIAPELLSSAVMDFRADIYSLGATVYHALAGRPPFAGKSLAQIIAAKVSEPPPVLREELPHVSTDTSELVAMMMIADPEQRVGDYVELMQRIDAVSPLSGPASSAAPSRGGRETIRLDHAGALDANAPTTPVDLPSESTLASGGLTDKAGTLRSGLPRRTIVFATALCAVLALATWLILRFFRDPPPPPRDMVAGQWGEFLFDGKSLEPWLRNQSGQWTVAEDTEGTFLSGARGATARAFPRRAPNFRLSLAARLNEADAVELHFGIAGSETRDGPRYVLRITRDRAVFGQQAGDEAGFEPISSETPGASDPERLYEIRLERQHNHWWAFFAGRLIGHAPAQPVPELPEFRLAAEGPGPAWFADVRMDELAPGSVKE